MCGRQSRYDDMSARPSTNRNGARWTLYGLPNGYTTAAPVGEPLTGWQATFAVPLLTFRGGPGVTSARYSRAILPRLNYARGWALVAYEVTERTA
jgi:hypothetical protein